MSQTIDQVYRDFNTSGVPASGDHKPSKPEIRALLKQIQNAGGQAVTRNTLSALQGVTPPNENYMGVVLTGVGAGYYSRLGGAWAFGRPFADTMAKLTITGGTANALQVSAAAGVDPGNVVAFLLDVAQPNTGPVTVSINGATPMPAFNKDGQPFAPGEWQGRMFLSNEGGSLRAISDSQFKSYFRGPWVGSASYKAGDYAEFGGSIWLALRASTGVAPVEGGDWTLFLPGVTVADASITEAKLAPNAQGYRNSATRCRVPTEFFASTTQMMSVSVHEARGDIRDPVLVFANWYLDDTTKAEMATGSMTLTASIEYPVGVFTQAKFTGSTSVVVPGLTETSTDPLPLNIPDGAQFRVRTYQLNSSGCIWAQSKSSSRGEAGYYGSAGVTDQTMGGSVTNLGADAVYRPVAILANTTATSIAIWGDSREEGVGDSDDGTGLAGYVERIAGGVCATVNLSKSGDRASFAASSHVRRLAVAKMSSTKVVLALGINDVFAGRSANQIRGNLEQLAALFPTVPVYLTTLGPTTTSTDNWATLGNQTVTANEAVRNAVNGYIRDGSVAGVAGYFDLADALEFQRSGKWQVPALTADGTHATLRGYRKTAVEGAGAIDVLRPILKPSFRLASPEQITDGESHNLLVTPSSLSGRAAFQAGKNGVNQTGVLSSTDTLVTFPSLAFDIGGYFDIATGRWYPPAGLFDLRAVIGVLSGVDGFTSRISLRRNGVVLASGIVTVSGTSAFSVAVQKLIKVYPEQVGAYFDVVANIGGSGDKTISGGFVNTWFEGRPV